MVCGLLTHSLALCESFTFIFVLHNNESFIFSKYIFHELDGNYVKDCRRLKDVKYAPDASLKTV